MSATHQAAVGRTTKPVRPPKPGQDRACLKCGAIFRSSGPGNRICPRCAKQNAEMLPQYEGVSES